MCTLLLEIKNPLQIRSGAVERDIHGQNRVTVLSAILARVTCNVNSNKKISLANSMALQLAVTLQGENSKANNRNSNNDGSLVNFSTV